MFTTTPVAAAGAAHAHHGFSLPNLRAALMNALDHLRALHYAYIRMRIEGELRGPAGRLVRREQIGL